METPVSAQQIPDAEQRSPYNNFSLANWKRAEKRVMVFIRRDVQKQKLRQRTSEHPFGTIHITTAPATSLCNTKRRSQLELAPGSALCPLQYPQWRSTYAEAWQNLIERYRRITMPKNAEIAGV